MEKLIKLVDEKFYITAIVDKFEMKWNSYKNMDVPTIHFKDVSILGNIIKDDEWFFYGTRFKEVEPKVGDVLTFKATLSDKEVLHFKNPLQVKNNGPNYYMYKNLEDLLKEEYIDNYDMIVNIVEKKMMKNIISKITRKETDFLDFEETTLWNYKRYNKVMVEYHILKKITDDIKI